MNQLTLNPSTHQAEFDDFSEQHQVPLLFCLNKDNNVTHLCQHFLSDTLNGLKQNGALLKNE